MGRRGKQEETKVKKNYQDLKKKRFGPTGLDITLIKLKKNIQQEVEMVEHILFVCEKYEAK